MKTELEALENANCEKDDLAASIDKLSQLIQSGGLTDKILIDILLQRGDTYRKMNKFGDAIRDYRNVVRLDPHNDVAKTKIALVENILSIGNTFYYENAYTDEDLFPEM